MNALLLYMDKITVRVRGDRSRRLSGSASRPTQALHHQIENQDVRFQPFRQADSFQSVGSTRMIEKSGADSSSACIPRRTTA